MSNPETRLLAHSMPYPLARSVCAVDAESERAPERKLLHILFALENLAQLLGAIVLADVYARDDAHARKKLIGGLKKSDHLSLGLWSHVLQKVAPSVSNPWIPELVVAVSSPAFREPLDRLTERRNELAHPAHPIQHDAARLRLPEVRADFESLLQQVSFLSAWHLVGVADHPRNASDGLRMVDAIPLRGTSVSARDVQLPVRGAIERHDVVLVDPDVRRGLVLEPFFRFEPNGGGGDVLTLTRRTDETLYYYAIAQPDTIVQRPLLDDEQRRPLDPWAWLESRSRRPLTARFEDVAASRFDDRAILRRQQGGGSNLPLRALELLRSGGMSHVFVGRDTVTDERRVLKVPRTLDDRDLRMRIEQEYTLLSKQTHPGIIRAFHCINIDGVGPSIVEEFFDHPSLEEHLAGDGFTEEEVAVISEQLLDAVASLHDQGIVHRDLSLANVLYDRDLRVVKLIDLGIARHGGGNHTIATRGVFGTPGIMAPEQFQGGEASPATDVYALALLIRALYGGREALGRPHRDFDLPEIPTTLRLVLARAVREQPNERFADARTLAEALRTSATAEPQPTEPHDEKRELVTRTAERNRMAMQVLDRTVRRLRDAEEHLSATTAEDEFIQSLGTLIADTQRSLAKILTPRELKLLIKLSGLEVGSLLAAESGAAALAGVVGVTSGAAIGSALGLLLSPIGVAAGALVGGLVARKAGVTTAPLTDAQRLERLQRVSHDVRLRVEKARVALGELAPPA